MVKFNYGLEFECLLNEKILGDITVDDYHGANAKYLTKNWKSEWDGSLVSSNHKYKGVEFISKIFTRENLNDMIDELAEGLGENPHKKFKNLAINSTCGAHIHFSVGLKPHTHNLHGAVPVHFLEKIRNKLFLSVNNHLSCSKANIFVKQYYRQYAKSITSNIDRIFNDRYLEFNFTPSAGIEWRSFNLLNCESWLSVKKMYNFAFEAIETINDELENDQSFLEEENINVDMQLEQEKELVFQQVEIIKQIKTDDLRKTFRLIRKKGNLNEQNTIRNENLEITSKNIEIINKNEIIEVI